jgi:alpha/beta superfamily hydrolase
MQKFRETPTTIQGPVGNLEAVITQPETQIPITGIVCHPHPLYGGTMNNKVVTTLVKTFASLDVPTIRFNFRGIGKSEGEFAQGIGELEDLRAVINWSRAQLPNKEIWLAGFSFGAYIAARAATEESAALLITVAPAVNHADFDSLPEFKKPWIVVQGDQDEVVPAEEVFTWIKTRQPIPELIVLKGATHFFHGRLIELQDRLKEAILKIFPSPASRERAG